MAPTAPWTAAFRLSLCLSMTALGACGSDSTPAGDEGGDANDKCTRFPGLPECSGGGDPGEVGDGEDAGEGEAEQGAGPGDAGDDGNEGAGAGVDGAPGGGEGEGEAAGGGDGGEGEGEPGGDDVAGVDGQAEAGEGEGEEGDGGGDDQGADEGADEGGDQGGDDEGGEVDVPPNPCPEREDVEPAGSEDAPAILVEGDNGPFYLRGVSQWFEIDVPADTRLAVAALDQGDPFYITDLRISLPDQGVGPIGADSALNIAEAGFGAQTVAKVRIDATGSPNDGGALCAVYTLTVLLEPMDAACAEDPLEDNDGAASATTLPLTPQGALPTELNRFHGLQICPGDSDWFALAFDGLPLEQVFIDVVSDDIDALTLSWTGDDGEPLPNCIACGSPDQFGNRKSVSVIQDQRGVDSFVHVRGVGADSEGSYSLEIRYRIGEVCEDDLMEVVALPTRADRVLACAGADHVYCFDHPGGPLGASTSNGNQGDVQLSLRTMGGELIDAVDDTPNIECIFEQDVALGRYCVTVSALQDSTYDMLIDEQDCR